MTLESNKTLGGIWTILPLLHGCEIDDNSHIGIHAVILDKTKIGS